MTGTVGTILVVDDNADVRGLAKRILEIAGYTVITAADGEEGLRCYEKHRSSIVLLLTDVVMPNIGGFELAERVLGMDSQVSVVLMSGDSRVRLPELGIFGETLSAHRADRNGEPSAVCERTLTENGRLYRLS